MTKYPRDEFDRVPEISSRQGVHRAQSAPRRPRLAPILAVGMAALAIGLVAFLILPKLGLPSANTASSISAASAAGTGTPSPSPESTAGAESSSAESSGSEPSNSESGAPESSVPAAGGGSATAEAASGAEDPGAEDTGAEDGVEPAAAESASVVDKSQQVAVYNGTTTAGLAGRVGGVVQAEGWQLGPVGNWGGTPPNSSVIFYNGAAQQANAEALSVLLNIPTLVESADFQAPVVVLLGPGYQQ